MSTIRALQAHLKIPFGPRRNSEKAAVSGSSSEDTFQPLPSLTKDRPKPASGRALPSRHSYKPSEENMDNSTPVQPSPGKISIAELRELARAENASPPKLNVPPSEPPKADQPPKSPGDGRVKKTRKKKTKSSGSGSLSPESNGAADKSDNEGSEDEKKSSTTDSAGKKKGGAKKKRAPSSVTLGLQKQLKDAQAEAAVANKRAEEEKRVGMATDALLSKMLARQHDKALEDAIAKWKEAEANLIAAREEIALLKAKQ